MKDEDIKKLMGCCLEIAVKFFFRNFVYTFGGEMYVQDFGGPIGARLTMCLARVVLQAWSEEFSSILKSCDINEHLRAIYVDDGRNVVDKLKLGTRYDPTLKRIKHTPEKEEEDRVAGVNEKQHTVEIIREIMNSINPDLKFTTEIEEDFECLRLPTLSFEIWSSSKGIMHSYYEKPMRCQTLTMEKSSQSEQSKYSILVNELSRRFEVMSDDVTLDERISKINHFAQQLKNSGYEYKQSREIVISMLKGWSRKEERRKGQDRRYLSAQDTLFERNMNKLTEATTWYRKKKENSTETIKNLTTTLRIGVERRIKRNGKKVIKVGKA